MLYEVDVWRQDATDLDATVLVLLWTVCDMSRRRLPPSDARTTKANNILADIVLRTPYIPAHNHRPTADEHAPPAEKSTSRYATLLTSLVDFSFILSLVFGGCCA